MGEGCSFPRRVGLIVLTALEGVPLLTGSLVGMPLWGELS